MEGRGGEGKTIGRGDGKGKGGAGRAMGRGRNNHDYCSGGGGCLTCQEYAAAKRSAQPAGCSRSIRRSSRRWSSTTTISNCIWTESGDRASERVALDGRWVLGLSRVLVLVLMQSSS